MPGSIAQASPGGTSPRTINVNILLIRDQFTQGNKDTEDEPGEQEGEQTPHNIHREGGQDQQIETRGEEDQPHQPQGEDDQHRLSEQHH